jgi:hypothetical protein
MRVNDRSLYARYDIRNVTILYGADCVQDARTTRYYSRVRLQEIDRRLEAIKKMSRTILLLLRY